MNWTIEEERILSRRKKSGLSLHHRWLILLALLGIVCTVAHFTIEPRIASAATIIYPTSNDARLHGMCDERPTRVIVETPEEDNAYYCRMIRDKDVKVVGAEGSITKLCAKEGVTL